MTKKTTKKKKTDREGKKHAIVEIQEYLDVKYEFRRNELSTDIEVRLLATEGKKENEFQLLDDPAYFNIWIELQIAGFRCADNMLKALIVGRLAELYNPLKEYFTGLPPWDGHDYIADLVNTIIISEIVNGDVKLRDLWPDYFRRWLIASAGTAISFRDKNGRSFTNDLCLVLAGAQGKGKTRWLNSLTPKGMEQFCFSGQINPIITDNGTANLLAEKFIIILDDQLQTTFHKDFNSMKSIITAQSIMNRKAWAKFAPRRARVASFAATVDDTKFLTDTKNRRYIVFKCDDVKHLHNIDMDKVWSQALHFLNQGEQYWLSQEDIEKLNRINDVFRQVTPEEEYLIKCYSPCDRTDADATFLQASELLYKLNLESGMKLSMKKLSQAMEHQGYGEPISRRVGDKGVPRKVYPVKIRNQDDEEKAQSSLREEFEKKTESLPL